MCWLLASLLLTGIITEKHAQLGPRDTPIIFTKSLPCLGYLNANWKVPTKKNLAHAARDRLDKLLKSGKGRLFWNSHCKASSGARAASRT